MGLLGPEVSETKGPPVSAGLFVSGPVTNSDWQPQANDGKLRMSLERGFGVEPRFLLLSDVATELNVSDSQVYHMVRSGELPAIKIGGRGQWRVERAKLEEYIQQKYAETARWVLANPLTERDAE